MQRLALASLTALLSLSCSKDSSSTPSSIAATEVGIYTLQTLDGRALPTSISEGGTLVEVTAGTLTLGAGGSLQVSTTFRLTAGASPQTQVVSGTYRLQGSSLSFSYTNGGANSGTLNGSALLMTNNGVLWS